MAKVSPPETLITNSNQDNIQCPNNINFNYIPRLPQTFTNKLFINHNHLHVHN